MLAPNDEALEDFEDEYPGMLGSISEEELADWLRYQVIQGEALANVLLYHVLEGVLVPPSD